MTEAPEEGRGTTGEGRASGLPRRNLLGPGGFRALPFSADRCRPYGSDASRSISQGTASGERERRGDHGASPHLPTDVAILELGVAIVDGLDEPPQGRASRPSPGGEREASEAARSRSVASERATSVEAAAASERAVGRRWSW